jgi:glycosyltransferase involved in cell wall biosynthesis
MALNQGLIAARAELVARMDADDEARPDRLERQLAALEAQPDTAVLGTGCEIIDADDRVISAAVPKGDPVELREDLLKANCLIHLTVTMRRRLVLAIGGYRPVFTAAEDYDLRLRVSERHNLSNLPDLLLRYRAHGGQATARRWRLRLLEVLAYSTRRVCAALTGRIRCRGLAASMPRCYRRSACRGVLFAPHLREGMLWRRRCRNVGCRVCCPRRDAI